MTERGYTRKQAAEACGVTPRTIDRYVAQGLVKGRIQFRPGHGHMRVFTHDELLKMHVIKADQAGNIAPGLRKYFEEKRTQ